MADLIIRISGDIKDYKEALEDAEKKTEDFSSGLKSVTATAAVAFAALTAAAYSTLKAYGDQEKATRTLSTALQQQGIYSRELMAAYQAQADAVQNLTGVDGDAIRSGQAVLQMMIGQTTISEGLTKAVVDLSVAKGIDLVQAFEIAGKAINGNEAALKKMGVEVNLSTDATKNMEAVTRGLTQAFGGQAEAANKGLGSIKGLQVAFGDFQESIGERLAPIITRAVGALTSFFNELSKSSELATFAASLLAGGIALTGFVATLGTVGIALNVASGLATAFGISLTAALGPIGLAAAAVTGLAAALGYMAINQTKAQSTADVLRKKISDAEMAVRNMEAQIAKGGDPDYLARYQRQVDKTSESLQSMYIELRKLEERERAATKTEQDPSLKANADKAAQEKRSAQARAEQEQAAHLALMEGQLTGHTEAVLALEREEVALTKAIADEKNEMLRGKLEERLAIVRQKIVEQADFEREQAAIFSNEMLAANEEYEALSDEQKAAFLEKNKNALAAQIQTEKTTRELAVKQRLELQVKEHNEFLANQQKFGLAYAMINQVMNSAIYQGSKQAFGELAQLQTSSNSTLKAIGKAAALVNIGIKTAESAMNIYAGFSTIPVVGPALGVAGAAAAVAFGAEQAAKVTAAADGGLILGPGGPTSDRIPAMLSNGELVVPARNFDEVVNAVAAQRGSGQGGSAAGGGGESRFVFELKDQLVEFIELKILERQNLGVSYLVQGSV